jgi:thiamine biosynthesis protein ThiS
MQIVVNGKPVACAAQTSLHSLILQLGFKPEAVVAERNRELVPGEDFARTSLEEGDKLEVLHFVGGG